jgi:hypothetical protein
MLCDVAVSSAGLVPSSEIRCSLCVMNWNGFLSK